MALKDVIKEMGVTVAHDVAGGAGGSSAPLFKRSGLSKLIKRGSLNAGGYVDPEKAARKRRNAFKKASLMPVGENEGNPSLLTLRETLGLAQGTETNFDASDVISKLDAAEKRARADKDTITFGLEDEEGNIIKVYVKADQAEEFESALAALLAGEDEDEDEENTPLEIAEVLFQLKDKFEIVDVEWPEIEGDPEEEQEVAGAGAEPGAGGETAEDAMAAGEEGGAAGGESELGAEGGEEGLEGEDTGEEMVSGEEDAKSALQQVIDMMKADAEARKAEADAKKAEAKAKEAEYVAQAASSKVKQEEEVMDMEAYYDKKKEEEKEAKQLQKMAKYKHDMANDADTKLATEEEEKAVRKANDLEPWRTNDGEDEDECITPDELATLIFHHLKAN